MSEDQPPTALTASVSFEVPTFLPLRRSFWSKSCANFSFGLSGPPSHVNWINITQTFRNSAHMGHTRPAEALNCRSLVHLSVNETVLSPRDGAKQYRRTVVDTCMAAWNKVPELRIVLLGSLSKCLGKGVQIVVWRIGRYRTNIMCNLPCPAATLSRCACLVASSS